MTEEENKRPYSDKDFFEEIEDSYKESVKTENLMQENKQILAEIQNKKLKMQKQEIDRISDLQTKISEEDILDRSFSKDSMLKSVEDRKSAVLFMNEDISEHIIIAPGSLVVIPSMTNNGKSTLVAHISEALIKTQESVLVLANEETEDDVRARVSCLRANISFGDYKSNKCSQEQIDKVLEDAAHLASTKKLIVISSKNEADAYRVTTVDGVISTLKKVNEKVSCVILDYYNNVNISEFGAVEPWHVNNRLSSELNNIKGSLSYPIIVMAQCEGIKTDKKTEDKGTLDFESNHPMYRWRGGKNLLIYATDIIELTKDFDNSCSWLFAHKIRFGHGNLRRLHPLPFDKKMQRFTSFTAEFDASVTASKAIRKTSERSKDLGLDKIFSKDRL